ncbi:hypothetical protein SprV_0802512300 [Sparganum proliferum]
MASRMYYKFVLGVICLSHLSIGIAGIIYGSIKTKPIHLLGVTNIGLNIPFMLIGLGALLVLLAIVAAVGHLCDSRFAIWAFLALSILTAIIHIGLGSHILTIRSHVNDVFNSRIMDPIFLKQAVLDDLQSLLKCCGMYSINYYTGWRLPNSCCPENTKICIRSSAYARGCSGLMLDILNPYLQGLGGFLLGLFFIQILLVFLVSAISPSRQAETHIKEIFTDDLKSSS